MLSGPLRLTTNKGNLFRNVCSLVAWAHRRHDRGRTMRHAGSAKLLDVQDLTYAWGAIYTSVAASCSCCSSTCSQLGRLLSDNKSSLRTHSLMEHLYLEGSLCTLSLSYVNLVLRKFEQSRDRAAQRKERTVQKTRPEGAWLIKSNSLFQKKILSFPWKQDFQKEEHDCFLSPYHAICLTFICKTCNLWWHVMLFDPFSKFLANPQARILWRRNYESVRSSRWYKEAEIESAAALSRWQRSCLTKPDQIHCHLISLSVEEWNVRHSATGFPYTAVGTSNATTRYAVADANCICHVEAQEKLLPIMEVGGWIWCLHARAFFGKDHL